MKRLLITGGTGSFGREMIAQSLSSDWDKIRIFSRDEKKQNDLRMRLKSDKLEFFIGDVRDAEAINSAMRGVTHVFHASALKQVPSCEFFPVEAIKTNTIGTYNTIRAAKQHGVERFVLLSTDKAAYPINAMGMSKAMAEKIALSEAFSDDGANTVINITRYGNVMGSRGSVIPLFYAQAEAEKPLSITNPSMTRFMMSLPQSVGLVDFAMRNGRPGELFIHKARAATIEQVADAVALTLGLELSRELIGTRGGEKDYETLVTKEEMARATDLGDYYYIKPDGNYLGYNKYFEHGELSISQQEEFNSDNTQRMSTADLASWFDELGFSRGQFFD